MSEVVLPLFDSGSANGQLFYVMPFVEAETLRMRLEREKQLPSGDALRIAREVADALPAGAMTCEGSLLSWPSRGPGAIVSARSPSQGALAPR